MKKNTTDSGHECDGGDQDQRTPSDRLLLIPTANEGG